MSNQSPQALSHQQTNRVVGDKAGRLLVLLGAAAGIGLSLFITIHASDPDAKLAGCGGGDGCSGVWATKWSSLFGLPVGVFAMSAYLLLASYAVAARRLSDRHASFVAGVTIATAAAALLSIAYFVLIQFLVIGQFCIWCLATHLAGLTAIAGIALMRPWRTFPPVWGNANKKAPAAWCLAGVGVFSCFALLQAIDPGHQTHQEIVLAPPDQTAPIGSAPLNPRPVDSDASPQITEPMRTAPTALTLPNGASVALGHFPTIGPADADKVVIKLFDYTCNACRDIHNDLDKLWPQMPGEPALVLIPCPLHRSCHPGLTLSRSVQDREHANACAYARLGLVVWRQAPEQFRAFHNWLFETRPAVAAAQTRAATLVGGEEALMQALADAQLQADFDIAAALYATVGGNRMPKLFLPNNRLIIGVTRSEAETRVILLNALR